MVRRSGDQGHQVQIRMRKDSGSIDARVLGVHTTFLRAGQCTDMQTAKIDKKVREIARQSLCPGADMHPTEFVQIPVQLY